MDTNEIISILRKQEYSIDDNISGKKNVLGLDLDQNKIYSAILKTIPKNELQDIWRHLLKTDCTHELLDKIKWLSEEHPKAVPVKNEPIITLLKLFQNKKSRRVAYARKQLRERFIQQSYLEQNRILKAFLKGSKLDCQWAGRKLRDNWRPELKYFVTEVWEKTRMPLYAYIILRHFPNNYILQEEQELGKVVDYAYICARIGNESSFFMDTSRLTVPGLFYVMAKLNRVVDSNKMEHKIYDYLLNYDYDYLELGFMPVSFAVIRGMNHLVWAMGVLGMQDALVRLLQFENRVKERSKVEDENGVEKQSWPAFVYAIKNEIDPSDSDNRLRDEILAYESRFESTMYEIDHDTMMVF